MPNFSVIRLEQEDSSSEPQDLNVVLVVDGIAVANIHSLFHDELNNPFVAFPKYEELCQALNSNPTVIVHPPVKAGSLWDGSSFSETEE